VPTKENRAQVDLLSTNTSESENADQASTRAAVKRMDAKDVAKPFQVDCAMTESQAC
jgi:hypothetical protein